MEGQTTYEYIRAQRAAEQVERETGAEDQTQIIRTITPEVKTGGQSTCDCEIFRGNRVAPDDRGIQV
jgi:hypothetical protein